MKSEMTSSRKCNLYLIIFYPAISSFSIHFSVSASNKASCEDGATNLATNLTEGKEVQETSTQNQDNKDNMIEKEDTK